MHWPMKHTNASSSNNSHRCIVTTTADAMSKASSPRPRVDDSSCCDCDTLELEVTITVISLGGVVAKKYESKKSSLMPKRRKKQGHLTPATSTSVVASFCQAFTSDGTTPLTHVPSIPIENLDASCMSSTSNPTPQPIIHWPGMPHDDDDNANQVLSTLRFSRRFDREDDASSQGRFMPQTCPINVSISRHGHLIGLGKANVIIVGEENGVSSTVVPVSSTIKKVSSRYKSSIPIPMIKIKGDDLMFGLKSDAMLRVLVSVSKLQTPEKDVVENPKSFCVDRSSDPESDDNIAVVPDPEPQSAVCDNAITESGIKGKELVNAREEMQLAEPKEVRVRSRPARVRSTTVMRGSLFGEEPERQEKAEANDSQDVEAEAAAAEAEDIIPDFSELDETTTSLNVVVPSQTDANNDRDLDTALSFCVLSAILGSPAPSCVKKHGSGSKIANPIFWDLEDDIEDNIPDLHFDNSSYEGTDPPHKEGSGLNDAFTTASLSDDESVGAPGNNEEELIDLEAMDIVPDIDIVNESCEYHCSAFDEPSIKKAADSALAWSALALILHSPAPAAVTNFGSSPKNLDDSSLADLENELFTIQEVEEEASLPSLTDTAESPPCSPERKQREYMFKDSLDDNEFLPEIEAMANRIERCPYCKLLYCQEFPCSMRFKMEHEQQQPSRTYKEALMRGGD